MAKEGDILRAYVCNKCGRVVTLSDKMKEMTSVELKTDLVGVYDTMHFCSECKSKFYRWLNKDEE